jgi:hypothetical protein
MIMTAPHDLLSLELPVSRRTWLRASVLGAGGLALGRAMERIGIAPGAAPRRAAKAVILVWLDGGASHIDTFDAKPDAPEEVRGAWKSIATAVPGVQFGEGLGRLAESHGKFALIRSLNSDAGEHEIARHMMLTGYALTPALEYPSLGAVVARMTTDSRFPPHLAISQIPEHNRQLGPGFLPAEYAPFLIDSNPARPEYRVLDLAAPPGLDADRVAKRRELLGTVDRFGRDRADDPAIRARGAAFERAYRLLATKESREAFDLSKEKNSVRDRFGDHALGQGCLLARRLVEAGARFITIMDAGWDNHGRVHEQLSRHRLPKLDQALPVLFEDLAERGLWDDTLVVVMGDFGRTPKLNAMDGRDHWPRANCAILAGGAVKGGTVVGATDERGEQVVDRPVSPGDLAATIYTILGIDPAAQLQTSDGRPVSLVRDGKAIAELLV